MVCSTVLNNMPPAIEVHCIPFDCFLYFCLCRSGLMLLQSELRTRKYRNISRNTWCWLVQFLLVKNFQCHSESYIQITRKVSAISELPCASVLKRVFPQNLSYEDEFDFHENESWRGTHFHLNGFAQWLVLTRR